MDEFRTTSHKNKLKRGKKRLKMLCRWAQKSKFTSRHASRPGRRPAGQFELEDENVPRRRSNWFHKAEFHDPSGSGSAATASGGPKLPGEGGREATSEQPKSLQVLPLPDITFPSSAKS